MQPAKDPSIFPPFASALKNQLLKALPRTDFNRIKLMLEPFSLKLGQILYEPNEEINYVYFPTTAVVSSLYIMQNGSAVGVSLVGRDGVVGINLCLGAETLPSGAIAQCAGEAFRIKNRYLQKEFKRSQAFQKLFLCFMMSLLDQTSQTAACNRLHSIEKQLCRWLLLTHDRLDSDSLEITQDLISNLLGASRESVTLAARDLKKRKLIEYVRGAITIIDRSGMEAAACECYRHISKEYNRLLGENISKTAT